MRRAGTWVAGERVDHGARLIVTDKWTRDDWAEIGMAGPADVERAIEAAVEVAPRLAREPAHVRRSRLGAVADGVQARRSDFVDVVVHEAGKTQRDADIEVGRTIDSFRFAAERVADARNGATLDLSGSARGEGSVGAIRRVPVGPVGLIAPFNFPLNLVAHKVAPALATGCPFVLKPASATPVSAGLLGEVLAEVGLPPGAWSILPSNRFTAERIVVDPRLRLLSFTGSAEVGWAMVARAGRKRVILELGGNAAVVVDGSWDVADAARRIVAAAYGQAGQSCISVQRILVQEAHRDVLVAAMLQEIAAFPGGPPSDSGTRRAPMIHVDEADRIRRWVRSALASGARRLDGGDEGHGSMVPPVLMEGVPEDHPLWAEEAFGPVAVVSTWRTIAEAVAAVNRSRFGLQVGVLSRDMPTVRAVWDGAEVGGVIAGDVPTWRADDMPYGGVKDSGLGREGLRYAIEEMTEPRLLVWRP